MTVVSGGEPLEPADVKKLEVPWPLEEDAKFSVTWKEKMFRPSPPIKVVLRSKSSTTASWEASVTAVTTVAEYSSDEMITSLPVGEFVVELLQGLVLIILQLASSPGYFGVT